MPHEPGGGRFQTFLVTIVKENLDRLNPVISSFDESVLDYNTAQVNFFLSLFKSMKMGCFDAI